jgi:integrase
MSTIFRRGKTYWARARRNNREFRRSLKTTDRATTEKRFRAWLDQLDKLAWGEKLDRTYAEAEEKFIREHLTTLKPRSAKRYGDSLKHLSEHFGMMILAQVTSAELSSFETKRRSDGVTPSTIRRDFACLSSLMTSCLEWEWIDNNPVPLYLRRRARRGLVEGLPRSRYLTDSEEGALLAAATPALRSAITLAIDTGLRREELFSLEWWQVDTERGLITTTTKTKSGRPRKVPLPERSCRVLANLQRHDGVPHVLVNPDTRKRYVQQNKGFKATIRRANIADL